MGRCGALDIRIAVRPGADADPHRGAALPGGAAAPAGAVVLDRGDDTLRSRIVPEGHNHLVQHHLVEDLGPPGPQQSGDLPRLAAVAADEVRTAARRGGTECVRTCRSRRSPYP